MKIPFEINSFTHSGTKSRYQNHTATADLSPNVATYYQGQHVTNLIGKGYLGKDCDPNTRGSGTLDGAGVNIRTWCAAHSQGSWQGQIQARLGRTLCINCDDWNRWDAL